MWDLAAKLDARRQAGLYRRLRPLETQGCVALAADGRRLDVFCSNDYLGLAHDPRVTAAFQRAAAAGVGSGGAHLISGHRAEHEALEAELAEFLGRERALLFSTGYMANMGVIDALVGKDDVIYEDSLNHASLLDGARLSGARRVRYAHADLDDLRSRLAPEPVGRELIVTDGLFSMDGDVAPLPALARLARERGAWLLVDDAHGIGVLGARGAGSLELAGLGQEQVPVLVGTLGKALGTFGAFVAGSATLIDYLIQKARTFVYTTALPPALAAATRASLAVVRTEPWRREHLRGLVRRFRSGVEALGLPLLPSASPIQPLLVGDAEAALALSQALERKGCLVTAIRPPTVPRGTARLRVTFSAAHSVEQVDRLLEALAELAPRWPRAEHLP